MAASWHVNPHSGETGLCRATVSSCPFGSHFDTESEARDYYEGIMASYTLAQLISKSATLSSWRSKSWSERKEELESYAADRASGQRRLARKPPKIVWKQFVNGSVDVLGYSDEKSRVIELSESIEALEESSAKAIIVHELAHFLEGRPLIGKLEDHGAKWSAHALAIAEDSEIMAGRTFSKQTEHSSLEKLRRETQKIIAQAPREMASCDKGHFKYSNGYNREDICPECREKDYDLFAKLHWTEFSADSPAGQHLVNAVLANRGFGKENRP